MAARFSHLVVDAREPPTSAELWAAVREQPVLHHSDDEGHRRGRTRTPLPGCASSATTARRPRKRRPRRTGCASTSARRNQTAEGRRIHALGARRVDIGQSAELSWVVLAAPECNESCALRPHASLID
ncbi:VOC family protein [Actinomadura sp. WMMA1423]|uniref:VOC family protein n=1 Tax=Actinomadura sp. WMMA1423 TaxID=2591108 RepID=UPI0034A469AC